MNTKKDPREVLNLHAKENTEFVLREGVGYTIFYHGTVVDLRKIQRAQAEQIAKDPAHRYITFSEQRAKEDLATAQAAAKSVSKA